MTIKVTYNVTDIYVSESVSATYINVSYEAPTNGGGGVWGDITGTLSNQLDLQAALDAKVPYSGATANVDLGEFELKAGQIEFDQTPTGVASTGVMRWNDTTGVSETTLKGGNVLLRNGVDLVARVVNKVTPNTTLTKAAYQAVRVSGAQGQRLAVAFAQANNDANSADTIGLVTETIATNQEGFIMAVGQLENINTTGSLQGETWVDGDVLYLSPTTAGRITNIKPVAPNHIIVIGYVEYAHVNNGKIYVKVMNGWELGELHDVNTTGAVAGQVLKYNGTIWTPSTDVGITGSGVTGQVSYWNGTNTQTGSNNLFWDAANNRLGVGTNNPLVTLHANGIIQTNGNNAISGNGVSIGYLDSQYGWIQSWGTNPLLLNGTDNNVMIGVWPGSDNGNKLQVYGSTFLKGGGNTSATDVLNIVNSASTNLLKIRNDGSTLLASSLTANSLVKTGGTSTQYLMADGSTSTLTNPVTGTGVSGQVAYWSGTNTQTGSNNLFWDATNNRLRINTQFLAGNEQTFNVYGSALFQQAIGDNNKIYIGNNTSLATTDARLIITPNRIKLNERVNTLIISADNIDLGANISLNTRDSDSGSLSLAAANNNALKIFGATRNVLIQNGGTFTDSGQRLQVTGDTLLKGSGNTSATNALLVQNSDSTVLFRIKNEGGFNLSGSNGLFFSMFTTSGGTASINGTNTQFYNYTTTQAATSGAFLFTGDNFQQTSGAVHTLFITKGFVPTSGTASFSNLTIAPSNINQTGGANGITRGLYVNPTLTAAADWRSIEWSNNTGWGLYGAGTANNYLAGNTVIGNTTAAIVNYGREFIVSGVGKPAEPEGFVVIQGNRTTSNNNVGALAFYNVSDQLANISARREGANNTGRLIFSVYNAGVINSNTILTQSANLLLGSTTDSGERLQVNGTMKVTGASTFGGNMALTLNQNAVTEHKIINTTSGAFSAAQLVFESNSISGSATFGKYSTATTAYKIITASNTYVYNNIVGDIAILNDFATGSIKMAAGGSSTAQVTLTSAGNLCIGVTSGGDFLNIGAGTTAKAQINLAASTAPTTPNNGDIWFDGTNIKIQVGGVTKTFTLV